MRIKVAEPLPPAFVAVIATELVPAVVGVPEIRPVEVLTLSPAGNPVALNEVGELVPVMV